MCLNRAPFDASLIMMTYIPLGGDMEALQFFNAATGAHSYSPQNPHDNESNNTVLLRVEKGWSLNRGGSSVPRAKYFSILSFGP